MLSRLSLRPVKDLKPVLSLVSRSGAASAVVNSAPSTAVDDGVRDLVNFPRPVQNELSPPVRMGFVPESWFHLLYSRTGVTGPYVFGVSFLTFLYSKEILTMDHEFMVGLSEAMMAIYAVKKFGPDVAAFLDKGVDEGIARLDAPRLENMTLIDGQIAEENLSQWQVEGQSMLYDAKKENVGLQLEGAYRERLALVHSMVKKRLDFHLEIDSVKTRLEQRHIVRWVVDSVMKSLTPANEAAAMKQCLIDLKQLSAKV